MNESNLVQKFIWFSERAILLTIALATLFASASEIIRIISVKEVNLSDLFLLFIYAEVLGMVASFYANNRIPVTLPLIIAMTALTRMIIQESKDLNAINIIYEAIEHIEKRLSGLLEPDLKEISLGSAEVQKIFKVSKFGKIAGSKVINGEIKSKSKARIIRDGVVVYNGEIQSIFREKNQVKEVGTGLECGISIKDFIDFKEKDVIESYLAEEIQRSI